MEEHAAPAGPVIDVQALAAAVPANPSSLRGAPPEYDEIPGSRDLLTEWVSIVLESPNDPEEREVLQKVFNTYVGGLMHKRGLDRAEAVRRACEVVEQALQEAQRR